MKKRIFAVLLSVLMVLTMFTPALAEENNAVQVKTVKILRNENGFYMGTKAENEPTADLFATSEETVYISEIYSQDFFLDSKTIEITLEGDLVDFRQKLTLSVKDENGTLIAKQTGVYYKDWALVYQMQVVGNIEAYTDYFIELNYTGKYTIEAPDSEAQWADDWYAIKDIEVMDYNSNALKVYMANVEVGEEFTVFYEDNYEGTLAKQDVKILADKSFEVSFGIDVYFDINNTIYICEKGTTEENYNNWDYVMCSRQLYDFIETDGGEILNEGVYCEEVLAVNATEAYFGLYQKGFGYATYSESEKSKIDVYLFDATTGTKVSTLSEIDFITQYGEFEGYVRINSALNKNHKYMMVFKDGYSMRTLDVEVISDAKIVVGNIYDSNGEYLQSLPANTTKFYANIESYNISDRNNISVKLINESGQVVATSQGLEGSSYSMTVTKTLTAGEYTLKATYGNLVSTRAVNVIAGSSAAVWQDAGRAVYNGDTTYIECSIESENLNPANLTYKLEYENGTEKALTFHRNLFTSGEEKYFVVKINEEIDDGAFLRMYNGSELVVPSYEWNMNVSYIAYCYAPFIYHAINKTGSDVEIFTEGFTSAQTVTLCAYDDVSKTGKAVNSYSNTATSAKFRKSDLNAINTLCYYETNYGNSDKEFNVEVGGEWADCIYIGASDGIGNFKLDDSFSFQRAATNKNYEVLNLPKSKYAYYKLASSEAALASASYKAIEEGVLYNLGANQGKVTVYAKFKTSGGVESAVRKVSIFVDSVVPEAEIININTKLKLNEYGEISVPVEFSVNEKANIRYMLYDADGNELIGYIPYQTVNQNETETQIWFWNEGYDYSKAAKLVLWFEDMAGNKTEKWEYAVQIADDPVYAEFDAATGEIMIFCEEEVYGANIYAACFKNEKLTSFQKWEKDITYSLAFSFNNYDESADHVKIMIWDNELGDICSILDEDI